MKKLFILASVALIAGAACSKVEVADNAPDQVISFQVANYTSAVTKADGDPTSLLDEGFDVFTTYAWYTSTETPDQPFMTPATVEFDDEKSIWHATDRTYFWPKTGYINFYSFAGDHLPNAVTLDRDGGVSADYSQAVTVATDDNILVADAAMGFYNNPNATYGFDGVTSGVPTLFRHMLSRVVFDVSVDAQGVDDENNEWEVVVNEATVSYCNQGTLAVTFAAAPQPEFDENGHPEDAGSTAKYVSAVWTPEENVENATLSKVDDDVVVTAAGGEVSDPAVLIADSVVMPQILGTNVTIALNYTITHTYDGENPVVETVPVPTTAVAQFTNAVVAWNPNTIYTYHIIIKPDGEILFDPAVEAWVAETAGTYTIQ